MKEDALRIVILKDIVIVEFLTLESIIETLCMKELIQWWTNVLLFVVNLVVIVDMQVIVLLNLK